MALARKYRVSLGEKRTRGKIYEGLFFRLTFVENEKEKRFAFVVSARLSKKAVVRNKIKRRLIEGIRELLPEIKNGDYLFYAKKGALNKSFREIASELRRFLAKEGFLKNAKTITASN